MDIFDAFNRMFFPERASTFAAETDHVFFYIFWISTFFFFLVVGLTFYWSLKYRSKSKNDEVPPRILHNAKLEIFWTIVPTIICFVFFYWGVRGFMHMNVPPADALQMKVKGIQWRWDFTYPNNFTDFNVLRIPVNKPVSVRLESDDVLHSFFVPAFRVKMDAVPGRYTKLWFEATKVGEFNLFCAEYCGLSHAAMIAKVIVMEPEAYEEWLSNAAGPDTRPPLEIGKDVYSKLGCKPCHSLDGSTSQGPSFKGLWGKKEPLEGGGTALVDENYIRESLMDPNAKIVKGFAPVMPPFQGMLKSEQIDGIIEFIKEQK